MLYVGAPPRSSYETVEPALINPALKVSERTIDISLRLTDYWPSYSACTPEARRAYLQWLSGGRKAPDANIGYVFLFFYGLERRALIDAETGPAARSEIPGIVNEVRRLLGIYSDNTSFRRYASQLLAYMAAAYVEPEIYKQEPPAPEGSFELPIRLRIGLGQAAIDRQPVPPDWALAWALSEPTISRRTPVTRCSEIFESLFKARYIQTHGAGLKLPVNRTRLKLHYAPASAALRGHPFTRTVDDLPDVTVLTAPVRELQTLVNECSDLLGPYSRFVGRNPDKADALDAVLLLPSPYWPAPIRSELEDIKVHIGDGMGVMSFGELTGRLKSAGTLSRDKILALARALASLNLGMEPDVLSGQKLPRAEDKIALFTIAPLEDDTRVTPAYQAASVTLDLACSVAVADGGATGQELIHLARQIDSWTHLSSMHRKRLKAHLRLRIEQPATLASTKKRLEPLAAESRRAIARFLAHLAEADGTVTREEVKLLERVYRTLQVDTQLVYADLHGATSPADAMPTGIHKPQVPPKAFILDEARIAQLQKETEEVAALLSNVFTEQEVEPLRPTTDDEDTPPPANVWGLAASHLAFLRILVSRATWTRQELTDLASDMEVMLDGTLEHINEAALEEFDVPLTEGDDPVEINQALLEKLPA